MKQPNTLAQQRARKLNAKKARERWQSMTTEERKVAMPNSEAMKKSRLANIKIAQSKRWPK